MTSFRDGLQPSVTHIVTEIYATPGMRPLNLVLSNQKLELCFRVQLVLWDAGCGLQSNNLLSTLRITAPMA